MKTIFCDIDGTLLYHYGDLEKQLTGKPDLLPGAREKLVEWDRNGYNIILTTGRRESMRAKTIQQLEEVGIFYDQLIMGLGGAPRYIINDLKPDGTETAFGIQIKRNKGLKNVKI